MHAPFDDVILSLCSCANHLPRPYASECAGMRVGVEGAAKSLHLPRLHALQVTPAGVSVEGDFV